MKPNDTKEKPPVWWQDPEGFGAWKVKHNYPAPLPLPASYEDWVKQGDAEAEKRKENL